MDIPNYSVRVLVNGHRTKEYRHEGRTFIEARKGTEYEIDIRNNSYYKVLAIPSVDGLCTIDGKKAVDSSPGFIIQPNSSIRVKGYTYNNNEVGAFKFSEKGKGYASEKGSGVNAGVVGVKFIGEKVYSYWGSPKIYPLNYTDTGSPKNYNWYSGTYVVNDNTFNYGEGLSDITLCNQVTSSASTFSKVNSIAPEFNVETTWGSKKIQKTEKKDFERDVEVGFIEIFYSDRESLLKSGILTSQPDSVSFPQSFSSYASPPKGWN